MGLVREPFKVNSTPDLHTFVEWVLGKFYNPGMRRPLHCFDHSLTLLYPKTSWTDPHHRLPHFPSICNFPDLWNHPRSVWTTRRSLSGVRGDERSSFFTTIKEISTEFECGYSKFKDDESIGNGYEYEKTTGYKGFWCAGQFLWSFTFGDSSPDGGGNH